MRGPADGWTWLRSRQLEGPRAGTRSAASLEAATPGWGHAASQVRGSRVTLNPDRNGDEERLTAGEIKKPAKTTTTVLETY